MPHLAFVVNNADFLVSHRLPVVQGALAAGYEVTAVAPSGLGTDALSKAGCRVVSWRLRRTGQRPHEEAVALAHLAKLYAQLKPDIVHHVTVKAMLYGSAAARLSGVRAVVNAVSGLGYVFLSQGLRATVRREVLRAAYRVAFSTRNSAVILQNDDDEETLTRLGALRGARAVKIRGSGVNLLRFTPQPESDGVPLVVLPARLLVDKGIGEFVAAAQALQQQGVQARFALVGGEDEGNPAGVRKAQVERWVADGVVEWWGHRTDMPEVYRQAHVVCLPSYREGMPKALLEAAAMGRALVTTDVPGCRDAVAKGAIGKLVPVKNVQALALALGELIASGSERQRLGALAQAHARAHFGEKRVVEAHLELYQSLLLG